MIYSSMKNNIPKIKLLIAIIAVFMVVLSVGLTMLLHFTKHLIQIIILRTVQLINTAGTLVKKQII